MTRITLVSALLLSSLSIHSVSVAQASEKMTYEKAMKSDRETFHHETIPLQETIDVWDKYVIPPTSDDGSSNTIGRNYTLLWKSSSTSGLNSGNITLSQSFRDFDEIVTVGSEDGGNYVQQYRFTPTEYDLAVDYRHGTATLYERDSVSWSGKFTSNTYFQTTGENARLYAVYGVLLSPTSGITTDCTSGQTDSMTLYCSSGKSCETGKSNRTCSASGLWGNWQTTQNPICVAQSQSCP